jgi:hypothetical protein
VKVELEWKDTWSGGTIDTMPLFGAEYIKEVTIEHSCANAWTIPEVAIGHVRHEATKEVVAERAVGLRQVGERRMNTRVNVVDVIFRGIITMNFRPGVEERTVIRII